MAYKRKLLVTYLDKSNWRVSSFQTADAELYGGQVQAMGELALERLVPVWHDRQGGLAEDLVKK